MNNLLDAFWRAVADAMRPRVLALSLLPLLLMAGIGLVFATWGWQPALEAMSHGLEGTALQSGVGRMASWLRLPALQTGFPALLVVLLATPLIALAALLAVAWLMTPFLVRLVAQRRFQALERKRGGTIAASVVWSLGHTLLALVLLVTSVPFWLVPPLVLVLPPLIWGWLTCRVMGFDALAEHASKQERRQIMRQHRQQLLLMGIATALLGAAPGVVWASVALFLVAFAVLIPVAIWMYTLVFAFSALWFSHFCLAALQQLRQQASAAAATPAAVVDVTAREVPALAPAEVVPARSPTQEPRP